MSTITANLLRVEDALHDSPNYKHQVKQFEDYANNLEAAIQGLSKASKVYEQASKEYTARANELLQSISTILRISPIKDDYVAKQVQEYRELINEIGRHQQVQAEQFNQILVSPLEELAKADDGAESGAISKIRASRRRIDIFSADFESQLNKLMGKKTTEPFVEKTAREVEVSKSRYLRASQTHAIDLNKLAGLRSVEMLESLLSLMYAQYAFYHQAFSSFKDSEPSMRLLGDHIARARRDFEADIQISNELVIKKEEYAGSHSRDSSAASHEADDGYIRIGQQDDDGAPAEPEPQAANGKAEALHCSDAQRPKHRRTPSRTHQRSLASISLTANGVFEISGYMFLRSQYSIMASWQRRWFEINEGKLVHYQRADGKDRESIPLHLCKVKQVPASTSDRRNVFELIAPTRTYILQAESAEDLKAWSACLRQSIESSLYSHQPAAEVSRQSTAQSGVSGASKHASPASGPLRGDVSEFGGASDHQQTAQSARLAEMRRPPGNDRCVDCGRKSPEWAAINLGALICIECSGIHRSLGVHVSKVRSVKLDNWEPELVQIMMRVGNSSVNDIYEPHGPAATKPAPETPRSEALEYIMDKYASRRWVGPNSHATSDLMQAAKSGDLKAALAALAQGAEVDMHDVESGGTALMEAVRRADFGMLELLLLWGADPNVRTEVAAHSYKSAGAATGTALHLAVRLGDVRVVWYLVRRGAAWDTPDSYGLLPLDIALEESNVQMVMAIRYAEFQKASGMKPGMLGSGRGRPAAGGEMCVDMLDVEDSLVKDWAVPEYAGDAPARSGRPESPEFTDFAGTTTADASGVDDADFK